MINKITLVSAICFTLIGNLHIMPALAATSGFIDALVQQLGVSESQATGGAGSIFNYAKSKLSPQDFGQIAKVIPNMNDLLKAAPATNGMGGMAGSASSMMNGPAGSKVGSMLGSQAGGAGTAGGLASLAGSFSKLGLSPDMVQQFVPPILSYVEKYGGTTVKNLLASALI
jgi:hypothetical protein